MKKILCIFMALIFAASYAIMVFADGIDSPKKETAGCVTSASTTPADWAKEDVKKALELGILDENKTYYYGSYITREEFCEIIETTLYSNAKSDIHKKADKNAENPFSDTKNKAVIRLNSLGIIRGKSTDIFSPNDLLTREEAAVIFTRVLSLYPDVTYTEMYFEYDDENNISDWAKNAVQIMSNTGIMKGYGGGVFYPKSNLSTEEAVTIVMRLYGNLFPDTSSLADKLNAQMPTDENYMFSPLSIKMALALAANGAEGETKEELLDILRVNDIERFNNFSTDLIDRYSQSDKLTLKIANSVWVNTDNSPYDFEDSYKDTVLKFYNANAGKVNNKNAVKTINDWVKENTNGKIPSIINDSDFWAALVNAIYFKGSWEKDFSEKRTKPDTFTSADGSKAEIDFMNQTDSFSYSKTDDAEIVKLRYKTSFYSEDKNGDLKTESIDEVKTSMYLIKTDKTDVENILKNNGGFDYKRIALSVPKFKVDYSADITELLGLKLATNKALADFSGMMKLTPDDDLWIDKILHKTFINVDEEGTEAAAVTAVIMAGATSAKPEDPIEVKFDEPFYFVIRDDTNGEILFMGRYAYAE